MTLNIFDLAGDFINNKNSELIALELKQKHLQNPIFLDLTLALEKVKKERDPIRDEIMDFCLECSESSECSEYSECSECSESEQYNTYFNLYYPLEPDTWDWYCPLYCHKAVIENKVLVFSVDIPKRNLLTIFNAPLSGDPTLDNEITELEDPLKLYFVWLRRLKSHLKEIKEIQDSEKGKL